MSKKKSASDKLREDYKNHYIKKERAGDDDYYFLKPKDCICKDVEGMCMQCYLASNKILKYLKKNEEDFWDEERLRGISTTQWKGRLRKGEKPKKIK